MIDYNLLNNSVTFYEKQGFKRIEAPWMVSKAVDEITKPKEALSLEIGYNNKCLVASGEQSFLYLYLKGFLPKGKFQTITPCFRYESFDFLHSKYFMKNELIVTDDVSGENLTKIIDICLDFYRKYIPEAEPIITDIGWDIQIKGKELGSYGIRECEFLKWIYATGCAEPRMSNLIKLYGIPQS